METSPLQAMIRFGLGRRGTEPLPPDPAGWLTGQLKAPDPARFQDAPTTRQALDALRSDQVNKSTGMDRMQPRLYRADTTAQLANLLVAQAPFRERLVLFWANHFTVSLHHGGMAALVGPFIREVIRPHVTGRFNDLLLAVMRHPAMLIYLDNWASMGPHSPAGERLHRGLNENLARECMELHTVTPAAGYTQADVTEFAKILTGWSVGRRPDQPDFVFHAAAHEPGPKTLMGRTFPPGEEGGIQALLFLGSHPSTHHSLATKLARHFVADDPPEAVVRRIEVVLRDTNGDLGAASAELVRAPEAWQPLTKLRNPTDYGVAALRALDLPADRWPPLPGQFMLLGQGFETAPEPNGWPDRAVDWATPEEVLRRVEWSYAIAGRAPGADPMQIADASLGSLLRPQTAEQVRRAGSRREALAMVFSSPEFQRR